MFEKFGRMDLAGINNTAEKLVNDEDIDGLRILASENGIETYAVQAYVDGESDYLCDDITDAALARLDIEADDIGAEELMGDWADYVRSLVMDSVEVAKNVMDPGKSFIGCVGKLAAWSILHAEPVPGEIINAMKAAVTHDQLKKLGIEMRHIDYTKIGMPGIGTAKRLIREYYGG